MKKAPLRFSLFCLLIVVVLFLANKQEKLYRTQIFDKLDTVSDITILSDGDGAAILDACNQLLTEADKRYSHTNPASDISKINAAAGTNTPVSVDEKTVWLLTKAISATEQTDGGFDITVGAISDLWSFGTEQEQIPEQSAITTALETTGTEHLHIDQAKNTVQSDKKGQKITLGGIAKGAITEELLALLKEQDVSSALINLGGNTYALGRKAKNERWTVGIQDPNNPDLLIGSLSVENRAVITSGDYQRYFEADGVRYHHILNPQTGMPAASGLSSVTIVSPDATDADMLSTACFVLGYEKSLPILQAFNASAIFVTKDGTVCYSAGLDGQFQHENENYRYQIIP